MNQILVTEKLYITPEIKRKKRMYKIRFFLSVFLICILFSYYIYAENDRNKSEEVAHAILSQIEDTNNTIANDNTTKNIVNDVLVIALDEQESNDADGEIHDTPNQNQSSDNKDSQEDPYADMTESILSIPCIGISYPVLSETSDELLKISPCYFWGSNPNEVGNFCVVGHNYRNNKFFSKVPNLVDGDEIYITDLTGRKLTYEVYDKYVVNPNNLESTSQLTNGLKEVTLITCTNDSSQRVIVKAREKTN